MVGRIPPPDTSSSSTASPTATPMWMSIHSAARSGTPAASSRSARVASKSRCWATRPASSTAERATWLLPSAVVAAAPAPAPGR